MMEKNADFIRYMHENYPFKDNQFLLPFAVKAEGSSFVFRGRGGRKRQSYLDELFSQLVSIRYIDDKMIQAYTEIEAYTLCQHPTRPKPDGQTAHRMGKNDLWIAATTAVYAQRLITTDKDFLQLDGVFFAVDYIDIAHF